MQTPCRQTLWMQTYPMDAGHVNCDACWEATPLPPPPKMGRQTPMKTLACPKHRLRVVKMCPLTRGLSEALNSLK